MSNTNNPNDGEGHGTFTAGEIGEMTNNAIGGAGLVWNAQIMPVAFLDSSGNGTDTGAAEAIDYAVNHGAKVINASWGEHGTDSTIEAAIQYANASRRDHRRGGRQQQLERRHHVFQPRLVLVAIPQRDLGRRHRQQRCAWHPSPTTAPERSSSPPPVSTSTALSRMAAMAP